MRTRPALATLALGAALLAPVPGRGQTAPASPGELLDRLDAAWKARDSEAYLALWQDASPEEHQAESEFVHSRFDAGMTDLSLGRPTGVPPEAEQVAVSAQVFAVNEPRATMEQWQLRLRRQTGGWALVAREPQGRIDGLLHLALDPAGYRAEGLTFSFEDLELELRKGTLFASPAEVGPTAFVFVGEATVRFHPAPLTEQDQLRQFCGSREMVETVKTAFIRIHPADLHRVLSPVRLDPDPDARKRLEEAQRVFRQQASRSFVLDAAVPGTPWWTLPGLGDALVAFETARRGTLTFTVSSSEAEGISLFDRTRRRHICVYPRRGRPARYDEDHGRDADVLSHDLKVRFQPYRNSLVGEDTLRVRLLQPSLTLRLRLDEALQVHSIASAEGGQHLFFRVRSQDSLMVALGPWAGRTGEIALTVRYSGVLAPPPMERELLQLPPQAGQFSDGIPLDEVVTYTNRSAWYPQVAADDYATAHLYLDVPDDYLPVAGGVRSEPRSEGGRTLVEFRQDQPGKYITVMVGRFLDAGSRQEGAVRMRAYGTARTRTLAGDTLARAAEVLRFFAQEFGPCPYDQLALVLFQAAAPGGHSPPGLVALAERPITMRRIILRDDPGSVSDAPDFFLAHELAHQWWGHGLAGENYHERWLSEGAAQYAAARWIQHSQGEDAFRDVLRRMGRWALDRTEEGPISLGYRLGHINGDAQAFRAVVYDKGAYVLHMLRAVVGPEAFRAGLMALQSERRYGKVGSDDLREAIERASGRDLTAYFREWVQGTRLPRLRVATSDQVGSVGGPAAVVEVLAEDLPGPVPLAIQVSLDRGRQVAQVDLKPGANRFVIPTPTRPGKVALNPDRGLLATIERR